MKHKHPGEAGFTLVELLVTIAVAAVLTLSMTDVVTNYLHVSQRGRYLSLANSYVEAKVEALRNQGYNAINTGTTSLTSELPGALPRRDKSASMTITNPTGGIKQVDISVTYYDNGQDNTYAYSTYIGELGVGQ